MLKRVSQKLLMKYAPPEFVTLLKHLKASNGGAFPEKRLFATTEVFPGSVLVLSPHPDDEAIGMGGTLSLHLQKQVLVTVLYVTNGGGIGGNDHELVEVRRNEARALAEQFKFLQIFWDFPDTGLKSSDDTVSSMIEILQEVDPDVIYLPSFFDHHFDHFATNHILVDALKRIKKYDIQLLGYEVWDNMPFPNHILDITDTFEDKAEMLAYYVTPLQTADFTELCRRRNALHFSLYIDGSRSPTPGYAEAFCALDAKTYVELFEQYLATLELARSPLVSHFDKHMTFEQ